MIRNVQYVLVMITMFLRGVIKVFKSIVGNDVELHPKIKSFDLRKLSLGLKLLVLGFIILSTRQ